MFDQFGPAGIFEAQPYFLLSVYPLSAGTSPAMIPPHLHQSNFLNRPGFRGGLNS